MRLEPVYVVDFLFRHTLGRLPYYRRYAPDIAILGDSDSLIRRLIAEEHARLAAAGGGMPTFLDVGARDGVRQDFACGFDYRAMDLDPRTPDMVAADICRCPELPGERFDIVFSLDVFEHLRTPWTAAQECIRLARPGGLIVTRTLFGYRYHPEPIDFWRYSAQGLESLFVDGGACETIAKGYDIRGRRRDRRGVYLAHRPPIDWLGGFRENWQVLWVGRKRAA